MPRFLNALVVALAGLALPALAQTTPGFVVTADGDTLRGAVLGTIDLTAAREVRVSVGGGVPQSFTPATARTFVDGAGRRYVARTVRPEYGGEAQPFFLQTLVEGQLSLYRLAYGGQDDRFFVALGGAEPEGLYVTRDRVPSSDAPGPVVRRGTAVEAVNERYRTTLARAFYGCPELQQGTARLALTQRDLTRAVAAFNECVGAPATVADTEAARRRRDVALSVTPRLGLGAVSVSAGGPGGWRASPQALPYGGLLGEAVLLGVPGRLSFTVEGSVQRKGQTPAGFVLPTPPRTAATDVFGTTYAVLAYGVRYGTSRASVAPYVGAGLVSGFVLDAPEAFQFAVFTTVVPPKSEAGAFAEVGAEVPFAGGPFTFGARVERTVLGSPSPTALFATGFLGSDTDPNAPSFGRRDNPEFNTALTFVVGKRFGR